MLFGIALVRLSNMHRIYIFGEHSSSSASIAGMDISLRCEKSFCIHTKHGRPMKILVTGVRAIQSVLLIGMGKKELTTSKGTGFLGAHLVELLLREKHDVVVLDNFLTSQPSDPDHLAAHPRLQLIR
jgi:hypothetical protein